MRPWKGEKPYNHIDRPFGVGTQRTYYKDDRVIWKDMIVHVGAKPPTKVTAATFIVPVFDPENKRASTRVFRADAPYTGNDKWYKGSLCTNARSLGAWNPVG